MAYPRTLQRVIMLISWLWRVKERGVMIILRLVSIHLDNNHNSYDLLNYARPPPLLLLLVLMIIILVTETFFSLLSPTNKFRLG